MVEFTGAPTLTHHATNLPLPNNANIVVEAGDKAIFARRGSAGSAQWDLISYLRKSGLALGSPKTYIATNSTYSTGTSAIPTDGTVPQSSEGTEILTTTFTPSPGTKRLKISANTNVNIGSTGAYGALAIFTNDSASALNARGFSTVNASNNTFGIGCDAIYTLPDLGSITISARIGCSGTWRVNGDSTGTMFGAAGVSTLIVEELMD